MTFKICYKFLSIFLTSISILSCDQIETEDNPRNIYESGIDAYYKKDYTLFLERLKKAQTLAPDNPKIIYNLARAYAVKGNPSKAINYLQRAVSVGYFLNSSHNSDFVSIRDLQSFKDIQKEIEKKKIKINNSEIAFKIPEKDLIPESIAYDPITESFYLGSIHKRKIISISKNLEINDFVMEMQDGLWSIIGMKVDAQRRLLWVNSGTTFAMKGIKSGNYGLTGVFKYSLKNGKLIKKYLIDERPALHLFNDLTLNSRGDVFITDSLSGAVFMISSQHDRLELFLKLDRFTYPNGITLSSDDQFLFVSHTEGTSVINVNTKCRSSLTPPEDVNLCLIDGLYFHNNSLIATQNDNWQRRLVRFFLTRNLVGLDDPKNTNLQEQIDSLKMNPAYKVQKAEILEAGNRIFNVPTTGVIVGDLFYYIANSQINQFDHNGKFFPIDKLRPTTILKVKL
jgi:tetratricopeptide (TPR) repeat protein